MNYLIISNLALILFFIIYRYGLKRFTFFNLNRWYLLSAVLLAYIVPLLLYIDFEVPKVMQVTLPVLDLTAKTPGSKVHQLDVVSQKDLADWIAVNWLSLCYWAGVVVSFCFLCIRLFILLYGSYSVQLLGSFSFFKMIRIATNKSESSVIQEHEELHLQEGHSFDILFIELIRIFNWFNPIFILFRDELKFQHECIVDEHFKENKVAYAELLVACAMNVHPSKLSHEFSNKSLLKERIKMMFKEKSKSKDKLFYLSILPVAMMLIGLTINCKSPNKADSSSSTDAVDNTVLPSTTIESANIDTLQDKQPDNANNKGFDEEGKKISGTFGVFSLEKVDVKPEYPGGYDMFRKDVQSSVKYSQKAIDAGAKGTVELSFVINKEGIIEDIKVAKDVGYGMGQACVTALKNTKTWKPAMVKGFPASVKSSLPIRLDLSQY